MSKGIKWQQTLSLRRSRPDRPKNGSVKGFEAPLGLFFPKVPLVTKNQGP